MRSLPSAFMRVNPATLFALVIFMAAYSAVVLYLVGPRTECLSVRDFSEQLRRYELRLDAAGLLHRLADDGGDNAGGRIQDDAVAAEREESERRRPILMPAAPAESKGDEVLKSDGGSRSKNGSRRFFVYDSMPITELLSSDHMPNTVYYVWCGRRWFEFHHYLSVRSIIRHLRPDNLVFLYNSLPIVDSWTYNTWYSELTDEYPFFRPYQLDEKTEPACLDHAQPNMTFVSSLLSATGGMYVHENTILAEYPVDLRLHDLVVATDPTADDDQTGGIEIPALIASKRGLDIVGSRAIKSRLDDRSLRTRRLACATIDGYVAAHRKPQCLSIADLPRLFPRDIWDRADSFGRLARTIFYGTPSILQPTPSFDELIPNVAHIVWLGGGAMDFLFYLCVASLVYVAEVDAVYIHGNGPPNGGYWHLIKDDPKVHLIFRDYPRTVYGTPVNVVSHVTDVWRVDFMVKYGGIYVDTDVVFVRPLDRQIRGYDAIGSYDWTYWNHPFPDTINFGVALGKRNAPYWHKFQESMKWFKDDDWSWNGLRQPYRIQERHPDLVLIDPHLQVICYESKCHPTWWPDYHNESIHHLNSDSIRDWRKETYAFHWTLPTPFELKDHINLLASNTMFSEIGKFVLEKAGTLKYFEKLVKASTSESNLGKM